MIIITNETTFGPFKTVEVLADRLRCDGKDLPFTVIGEYTIDNNDGNLPLPAASAEYKAAKNLQINGWRYAANLSYFPHNGKNVACDALSRSDIDAVAASISLNGAFPAGFPGAWKAMDNSYIVLSTVDDFKSMYASMTAQGTTNFAHSQALKATLAAATTQSDVDAIVW